MQLFKAFHDDQLNKVPFAKAREEGFGSSGGKGHEEPGSGKGKTTGPRLAQRRFVPKLGLIENENFELYESEEETPTSFGSPPKEDI